MIFPFFLSFLFLSVFLFVLFSRRFLQSYLPVLLWKFLLYFPELFFILRIFLFITSYSCLVGIVFLSLSLRTSVFNLVFEALLCSLYCPHHFLWSRGLDVVFWDLVRKGAGDLIFQDMILDSSSLFAVWHVDPILSCTWYVKSPFKPFWRRSF